MINLLPPQVREDIMYSRRNTQLLRWVFALLIGFSGIVVVIIFGHFYIDQNTRNVQAQVEQAEIELRAQKLGETQKRVEEISSTLKLTGQVLSKQILFSKLLRQTGAVMPSGSALSGLTVNELSGGLELQAAAANYQVATQVQVNLQDPANKIFEKVDITSIDCKSAPDKSGYSCVGSYRGLFAKDHPFSFLGSSTGATP